MTALTAAALAGQSLHHWQTVPLGYSPRGILVGTVDALSAGMPAGAREKAYRGMLAEVRSATHGAALAADVLPTSVRAPLEVAAGWELGAWRRIDANAVSDGYFDLLQMQLVAGRGIAPTDDSQRRPVVVVNESAAKLFWPGRNPVGLRMRIRGEPEPREVAGVVADARYRPLGEAEPVLPYLFLPLFQRPPAVVVIHARTPAAPKGFLPVLRRIVAQTTGGAPLTDVGPLESKVQGALSQVRLVSRATGVVGLLGITLAAAGVFASGCYRVAQRRREIAIRIALGAVPGRIIGLFTTRGMLAGFAGSIAGLIPAAWSSQLLRASLRGIGTADAVLFAGLAIFLTAIATAASWIGARRIASIQPAEALAAE
jgi:hypothetical protein